MAGKIATRAAYGEALVELAEQYPELVVFDADLSNATMTKGFAAKYPERFFDMGIAECNMTGVAARHPRHEGPVPLRRLRDEACRQGAARV